MDKEVCSRRAGRGSVNMILRVQGRETKLIRKVLLDLSKTLV